jgi:RNA polymerase sigma factor (sigma-70 family)
MDKKSRFIRVVKEHEGLIYKVATLYTNTPDDRDDLTQEIVYQLWKSFDSFNEQSKLSTWMYRVAMNTAIYSLKLSQRKVETVTFDADFERTIDLDDDSDEERIHLLYASIQNLDLLDKGIILLYLEGKQHQEIADIVGISVSNVGTRISRIKEKLKHNIIKHNEHGT